MWKPISKLYSQMNPATLSGAIDILVVKHDDGSYSCSPFHVRFGKFNVPYSRGTTEVEIVINGEECTTLHMVVGENGEAYFLHDNPRINEVVLKNAYDAPSDSSADEGAQSDVEDEIEEEEQTQRVKSTSRMRQRSKQNSRQSSVVVDDAKLEPVQSYPEYINRAFTPLNAAQNPVISSESIDDVKIGRSDSHPGTLAPVHESNHSRMRTFNAEVVNCSNSESVAPTTGIFTPVMSSGLREANEHGLNDYANRPESPKSDSELANPIVDNVRWDWGERMEPYITTSESSTIVAGTPRGRSLSPDSVVTTVEPATTSRQESLKPSKDTNEGMTLENLKSADPSTKKRYLSPPPTSNKDSESNESKQSRNQSPRSPTGFRPASDVSTQTVLGAEGEVLHCDIELSLCGGLKYSDSVIIPSLFDQYLVTYEDFMKDPLGVLQNHNLVVKINGQHLKWQVAAPMIMSHVIFQRSLEHPAKIKLMKEHMPSSAAASSWRFWPRSRVSSEAALPGKPRSNTSETPLSAASGSRAVSESEAAVQTASLDQGLRTPPNGVDSGIGSASNSPTRSFSNRLTSQQISVLNLRDGVNDVSFRVCSQFMGSTILYANIFVYNHDDKIVISDVDGTVTKSDVLGQTLPLIGVSDWSQPDLAKLYQSIANNGYKFIYLSARAISMASWTKTYLRSVRQNQICLPDGPLFLSPSSLVSAFHQEVILKKPEEFKIRCLKDIQGLFPGTSNPFHSGFGNKHTDTISYSAVGIPPTRIFIINPKGDVRIEKSYSMQTSYADLSSRVDHIFPDRRTESGKRSAGSQEFNAFTFYHIPPPMMEDLDAELAENKLTPIPILGPDATLVGGAPPSPGATAKPAISASI